MSVFGRFREPGGRHDGTRGYAPGVSRKRPLTSEGARRLGEKERATGLDPEDEAARWLSAHDPAPPPATPKSAGKSKHLHRWKQRRAARRLSQAAARSSLEECDAFLPPSPS